LIFGNGYSPFIHYLHSKLNAVLLRLFFGFLYSSK